MADENIIPGPHVEGAKTLIEEIRALRAKIPRLAIEIPDESRSKIAMAASVPDAFVESAGAAIERSMGLQVAVTVKADPATLRDSFSFALAHDPVVVEAYAFARAVEHTIRVQRAKAGQIALDVYSIAQRLAKRKDGAEFVPHVADMREKLKRAKKRKATSEPAPVPPVTQAP